MYSVTHDNDGEGRANRPGDVANGHVFTAAGWLPLRRLTPGSTGPFYAGDLLDGNVYTGSDWVYVPVSQTASVPRADSRAPMPVPAPLPTPPRRRGLRGVVIAIAVLLGLGIVSSIATSGGGDSADRADSATPTPKQTPTPTRKTKAPAKTTKTKAPRPAPTTPAPDPEAVYAAEMTRLGWVEAADGLWLYEDFSCSFDDYSSKVTGTMTTAPGVSKRYVSISFGLYDDSGALLGSAIANINNLAEDTKWKFEAVGFTGEFATCKPADVTAF